MLPVRPSRRIRQQRGWSILRVAGIAGVSPEQVKRLELGDAGCMRVDVLCRIAGALDVRPVDLMPGLLFVGLSCFQRLAYIADAMPREAGERPAGSRPPSPSVKRAIAWLRAELAHGPVQVAGLRERAKAAGHSWRKIRLACGRLQVETVQTHFGAARVYQLPADADGAPEIAPHTGTLAHTAPAHASEPSASD